MNDYVPKVGDRVRATLGENVLVGTVRDTDQDWTEVAVSDGRSWTTVWHHDGWQFEQVVELPTKTGAIVSNNISGDAYVLAPYGSPGGQYVWYGLSGHSSGAYVGPVPVTDGGFTVEFEGIG